VRDLHYVLPPEKTPKNSQQALRAWEFKTMTIIYGIPNCDSVKKARQWLSNNEIDYEFVDVRENTPSKSHIDGWIATLGAAPLVNKRSTTWKNMDSEARDNAENGDTCAVLLANPTLIKRPVLEHNGILDVGFSAATYANHFGIEESA
jgi:arsenate reductase